MGSDTNALYTPDKADPENVIAEICAHLWNAGWLPGTAGSMSSRRGPLVYVTPSGVQKERMRPQDILIWDSATSQYTSGTSQYKPTASAPLFHAIYAIRQGAGAVIHTHSSNAVLVTLLWAKEFRVANIENIKAIPRGTSPGNLDYSDTLIIPIIENEPHEEELEPALRRALSDYPAAPGVLVRRHGLYVWGSDAWRAKIINEALEFLMDVALRMRQLGLDPAGRAGPDGTQR